MVESLPGARGRLRHGARRSESVAGEAAGAVRGATENLGVILRFWRRACGRYAANSGRNTEES
jgi:hypothetical protein